MKNLNIRFLFLALLLFWGMQILHAQTVINFQTAPVLLDQDVQKLVKKYRDADLADLKGQFAKVVADQPVKDAIEGLPEQWKQLSRSPAQIGETRLWTVGAKALKITTNPKYEFLYINNDAPLAISDSNCLLLITRGMLRLTDGDDDALLGVMIHELAHGLFVPQTLEAKSKFNEAIKAKDWINADGWRRKLALIEIECDLMAGRLLKDSKYKVSRFADVQIKLQKAEDDLKIARTVQWHPDGELRKKVLLELLIENNTIAKN